MPTEPAISSWVNRLLIEIAEESDNILFEVRSVAVGTRFIVEIDPEERLFADICAHPSLEDIFLVTDF